ncbi:sulfite exporter TauE/SafE family protein [Rubrolithibacter danxiaensis]|uniref:sulfite exporter TauE/SafE family protein n=1 Tax=Rubrolithibacter danxiaensis TaxID=3390805 RepID=UPI003BF84981
MNINALAFFTGLFGSLHCVAMCGPMVLAMPFGQNSPWLSFLQRFLYQFGRTFSYVLLGLLLGLLGRSFNMLGWQQTVSVLTGSLLVLFALVHFFNKRISFIEKLQYKLVQPLSGLMAKVLSKSYGGLFAGMLNGLLPCGMVYLALAGAVNSDSVLNGGKFMFYFGLGTTPLMLLTSVAGMYFRTRTLQFSKVLPYITLCLGMWFILRGAALNIPYLSPLIEVVNPAVCH